MECDGVRQNYKIDVPALLLIQVKERGAGTCTQYSRVCPHSGTVHGRKICALTPINTTTAPVPFLVVVDFALDQCRKACQRQHGTLSVQLQGAS